RHRSLLLLTQRSSTGGPLFAITLQTGLALAMLFTSSFETLLTYAGFMHSFLAAVTISALPLLSRRERSQTPTIPWISWAAAALFFVATLWTLFSCLLERPQVVLAGAVTAGSGLGVYALLQRAEHRARTRAERPR